MLAQSIRSCTRFVRPLQPRTVVVGRPGRLTSVRAASDETAAPSTDASIKIYCGNLSWETQRDDLEGLFSKFGQVYDAFVASDRETGRSRGFGFVTMDRAGGNDAIQELNETDFMGRAIRVNESQPMGDRPAGGRGGGYGGRGGGGRGYGGGRGGGSYGERRASYGSGRGGGGGNYGERRGGYGGGDGY